MRAGGAAVRDGTWLALGVALMFGFSSCGDASIVDTTSSLQAAVAATDPLPNAPREHSVEAARERFNVEREVIELIVECLSESAVPARLSPEGKLSISRTEGMDQAFVEQAIEECRNRYADVLDALMPSTGPREIFEYLL